MLLSEDPLGELAGSCMPLHEVHCYKATHIKCIAENSPLENNNGSWCNAVVA